jgi:predicted ATPase
VITGAQASGKTTFFDRLKKDPAFSGYLFFDELARQLLHENPAYRLAKSEFHQEIYRRQVAREKAARGKPFISDRGTVDAFAFHPEAAAQVGTTIKKEYARYTGVIQLGTAAALGSDYYHQDDIRCESADEAMAIERAITRVWRGHPGYHMIPAQPDVEAKYNEFMEAISAISTARKQ